MHVYSKKIIQFIQEIQCFVKEVISQEVGLQVFGDRFYDRKKKASYPIKIVIYNNKSMLGYFDAHFYELGFHEQLMHVARNDLDQVIRHEIAHYITFIDHGSAVQPHGIEFKSFCEKMGWSEEVSRATLCLDGENKASDVQGSSIFRKVQKLMALATSSNTHEAEQAMIKSQKLLMAHNIESRYSTFEEEEKIFLKRIFQQKKENAKMRSIAMILETFFVNCIYRRAIGSIFLEICGSKVNIEIAEYVADILQRELEILWNQAKKCAHVKGLVAKNSFFLGLAKGYCNKIQSLKREYSNETEKALMVIEKKLIDAKRMIYPRLSSSKSSAHLCATSLHLGEEMGRNLNIHPALKSSSNTTQELLTHF